MSIFEEYCNSPVQLSLNVQWGDMDAFQHVNNIMYFRYFESARIAYFQKMGIVDNQEHSIGPILAKTDCTFIRALTFPDEIICTACITEVEIDRFYMEYRIYSVTHQRLAAKGRGTVVSFDYSTQQKVNLPTQWHEIIRKLENHDSTIGSLNTSS